MSRRFIPSFHFFNGNKLSPQWCEEAVNWCYHNTNNINLLQGKNIDEIEQYSSGDIDMEYFKKKMSKDLKGKLEKIGANSMQTDLNPAQYEPLPLIHDKITSAVAITDKIPFEVRCNATDSLAKKKREEDLQFLENKPNLEAILQPFADQIDLGKVDLGKTKHSAIPYSDNPYGLDLNDPDEKQVFIDLCYSLGVESAYEVIMQAEYDNKNLGQYRHLETVDQYKYGVSCHRGFQSNLTYRPDITYIHPSEISTPYSQLLDLSDNTHRVWETKETVLSIFNMFGDEIEDENALDMIINGDNGYCQNNKISPIEARNFHSFKTNLVYMEVKSVDWVGVKTMEDGNMTFSLEENDLDYKIEGQNTYTFFWLKNTKYFFQMDKLGYAHRKKGMEMYQGFSIDIYRSQTKSAVELSIGANRMAQIAYIKMLHAIIMSLPSGKVVDLKGMRSVLTGALKDGSSGHTMMSLINLAFEENKILIDTEDFTGKNDGQLKPFYEIPGGVKSEINGYIQIINEQDARISQFTGANPQLTGQSANPEGLIGLQKLLINSSINSLSYAQQAINYQYQKLFNIWGYVIKKGIDESKEVRDAYSSIVESQKVSIIEGLKDSALHTMGITISFTQREEEKDTWRRYFELLIQKGVINGSDLYMLNYITNPKEKFRLLAVKEKQFEKKAEQQRQDQYAQQQQLMQQQGQNQVAALGAETDGKIKEIYSKADAETQMMTLGNQLGISKSQMDGIIKHSLQRDRGIDQTRKAVETVKAKADAEQQKSLI